MSVSLYAPSAWVKFPLTNLQAWGSQRSKALYHWDRIGFPPITNWSISPYTGPQTRGGLVLLQMKAANLDGLFPANIVFVPAQPGFSNMFVARTELTNGVMNIIPPWVNAN
ncbi:hypothetical protein SBV1_2720014 [Verrucomicrobia bacterium]|nr:hypothetical protein SBV1_2720014 [Verrucomicrobiota bacterium]